MYVTTPLTAASLVADAHLWRVHQKKSFGPVETETTPLRFFQGLHDGFAEPFGTRGPRASVLGRPHKVLDAVMDPELLRHRADAGVHQGSAQASHYFPRVILSFLGNAYMPQAFSTGKNLGPIIAEYRPKPRYMTPNKARRASKIVFLRLPVTQEVAGSSPVGPATVSVASAKLECRME